MTRVLERLEQIYAISPSRPGYSPLESDALVDAARFVLRVRESARGGDVATVAAVEVVPNASNVVPDAPELVSGAGHDAMFLASAGVSHSPDELSSERDISLAVDALTAALARLAR